MKKRILRPLPGMDLPFLILVLTLVGFGLVMLASHIPQSPSAA